MSWKRLPDVISLSQAHRQVWSLGQHTKKSFVSPAAVLHQFAGPYASANRSKDAFVNMGKAIEGHHPIAAMSHLMQAFGHAGATLGASAMLPIDAFFGTSRSYGYGHKPQASDGVATEAMSSMRHGLDVGILGAVGATTSLAVGLTGAASGALVGAVIGSVIASCNNDHDEPREHTLSQAISTGANIGAGTLLALSYPVAVIARAGVEAVRMGSALVKLVVGCTVGVLGGLLGALVSVPLGATVATRKAVAYLMGPKSSDTRLPIDEMRKQYVTSVTHKAGPDEKLSQEIFEMLPYVRLSSNASSEVKLPQMAVASERAWWKVPESTSGSSDGSAQTLATPPDAAAKNLAWRAPLGKLLDLPNSPRPRAVTETLYDRRVRRQGLQKTNTSPLG